MFGCRAMKEDRGDQREKDDRNILKISAFHETSFLLSFRLFPSSSVPNIVSLVPPKGELGFNLPALPLKIL
jgi:hypothetical protein